MKYYFLELIIRRNKTMYIFTPERYFLPNLLSLMTIVIIIKP